MKYVQKLMNKWVVRIFVIGIAVVMALCMDEIVSQFTCFVVLVVYGMWVVVKGLKKGGVGDLVVSFFLIIVPKIAALLSDSTPGYIAGTLINTVKKEVLKLMGSNNNDLWSNDTCLLIIMAFIFLIVFFVCNMDRTAMKKAEISENGVLEDPIFKKKIASFCNTLEHNIREINRETNWNEDSFTPIEAEVELSENGRRRRKYEDLLRSLKRVKKGGKIFLVIGEPGAGKSVSLRKLTLELLNEVKATGKIPIYINLKKWNVEWTLKNLPTKKDLVEFVKEILREKGDFTTEIFIDTYFDKMLEEGRWYFIFDSFDEMPCLAGVSDCQELIDKISSLLYELMDNAKRTGGIIASRPYKAPSEKIGANVVLKLQTFDDIRIRTMLQRYLLRTDEIINELFGKREDLTTLCRNPFYLSLLIEYVQNNGLQLPKNQMDLYRNFVDTRLKRCKGRIEQEKLSLNQVWETAKKIALLMYESTRYGLEYPIEEIDESINAELVKKVIKILEYAKICRVGGEKPAVSFVHRRFQEFFLMEGVNNGTAEIRANNYQDIINNSKLRDALVLYCEIVDDKKADEIVQFCWSTIQKNEENIDNIRKKGCLELVHALYFLTEAFRNRKKSVRPIRRKLYCFISKNLNKETDFVVQRAMVNSMVLLDANQLENLILKVFQLRNRWLCDIVVQNCRVIKKLGYEIEDKFMRYMGKMEIKVFWERLRNIHFSLSLSSEFKYIKRIQELLVINDVCCVLMWSIIAIKVLADADNIFIRVIAVVGEIGKSNTVVSHTTSNLMDIVITVIVMFALAFGFVNWVNKFLDVTGRHGFVLYITYVMGVLLVQFTEKPLGVLWLLILIPFILIALFVVQRETVYWIKKKKRKRVWNFKSNFKRAIFLIIPPASIIILAYTIDNSILITIFRGIIFVIGIVLVILLIIWIYKCIEDILWLRKHKPIRSITRSQLEKDLKEIKRYKNRGYYIESLLQNRTELKGEWNDGRRPLFGDDYVDYCLAKLDCMKIESCNYIF